MKEFFGGIQSSAIVNVLENGKAVERRLSDLRPGDLVGQVEDSWYFPVSEVRTFKRQLVGFKVTLESGESLLIAEGTAVCGQFGGNLVTDQKNEVLCLVNMGRFVDIKDSRRTFEVEFKAPEGQLDQVKKICRHSASRCDGIYAKKFYRYPDLLRFLVRLGRSLPRAHIVPGLVIGRCSQDSLYDLLRARKTGSAFFPLIRFTLLPSAQFGSRQAPAVLAFCKYAYSVESRKVVACERIKTDGPWAFPIFDQIQNLSYCIAPEVLVHSERHPSLLSQQAR